MDLRTGRIYESKEAALAAGVPEADLVQVERTADGRYRLTSDQVVAALGGSTSVPHQGKRDLARRAKREMTPEPPARADRESRASAAPEWGGRGQVKHRGDTQRREKSPTR